MFILADIILYCLYRCIYVSIFTIYLCDIFIAYEINSIYAVRSGNAVALKMTYSNKWLDCPGPWYAALVALSASLASQRRCMC